MTDLLSASVLIGQVTDEPITSENVAAMMPDQQTVDYVCARLAELGFEVGAPYGLTVSIIASRERFREVFGQVVDEIGDHEVVLPIDRLPDDLAQRVSFVWCSAPPDFGPGAP